MTFGKAAALTVAFLVAIAFGVWISPHVRDYSATMNAPTTAVDSSSAKSHKTQPAKRSANATKTGKSAKASANAAAGSVASMPASAPDVQDHVKPLLNRGTNVDMASDGFRDAEQFVMVAYAAKNTKIPFVLLKHRMLTEGKSLSAAIHESKPDIDARLEASRARAEAKSDMAKLRG